MTPAERAQAIAASARAAEAVATASREQIAAANRAKYPELYDFVRVFGARIRSAYVVGEKGDPWL